MKHGIGQPKHKDSQAMSLIFRLSGAGLILVTALLANMSVSRAWAADPSPTSNPVVTPLPSWNPATVQKVVLIRTLSGAPVPGLSVDLVPAPTTMGGPPEGDAEQHGRTDAEGMVMFNGMGRWIWIVSFTGQYQGRALQPVAFQGRSPYGRTRAGGGFPLAVEPQEEGEAPTPVVLAGQVQPEMQTTTFVLVSNATEWAPTLDLALPAENPIPLTDWGLASMSSLSGVSALAPQASGAEDDLPRWLYLLAVLGLMLTGIAWWQRRSCLHQPFSQAAAASTDERDAP